MFWWLVFWHAATRKPWRIEELKWALRAFVWNHASYLVICFLETMWIIGQQPVFQFPAASYFLLTISWRQILYYFSYYSYLITLGTCVCIVCRILSETTMWLQMERALETNGASPLALLSHSYMHVLCLSFCLYFYGFLSSQLNLIV